MDHDSGDRLLMTAFGGQTPTMTEEWSCWTRRKPSSYHGVILSSNQSNRFVKDWNRLGGKGDPGRN